MFNVQFEQSKCSNRRLKIENDDPLPPNPFPLLVCIDAKVAELADAPDLGSGTREGMGVRVPPFAPNPSNTYGQGRGSIEIDHRGWCLIWVCGIDQTAVVAR